MIKDILQFKEDALKPEYIEIIKKYIANDGKYRQLLCFVEELAEAMQELLKEHLDFDSYHSELIDVVICVEGIKVLYGFTNEDFLINDYDPDTLEDSILSVIVATSHHDRGRITSEQYRYFIRQLYISLYENLRDSDESYIDGILNTKFEKFRKQLEVKE